MYKERLESFSDGVIAILLIIKAMAQGYPETLIRRDIEAAPPLDNYLQVKYLDLKLFYQDEA